MNLLTELRNRGVLRAAAWYAAGAWVLIQVASTVFPEFDLPPWSVRAVIVVALLGLPVALLAAWTFDLSSSGIRRADPAGATTVVAQRGPLWRTPSLWIALAAGILLAIGAQQAWQRLVMPSFGERPRIAVLPFSNLSPDAENAYFADGLHEEILATLARVSGLHVISRTSVLEYRDTKRNLKDIAEALDVSLILEGSVRRVGDDVRLTLQLIDGRNDAHLWAQTYDRAFRDVLRLQETVALQIVSELGAKLLPGEQKRIAGAASSVPEAYDRYLHALALYDETGESKDALGLLNEAIVLDPAFVHAYALRALIQAWSFGAESPTPEFREGARADIERALTLQPDLPEALVARGVYHTYVTLDPALAMMDLERALALAPNDARAHQMAGFTARRLGRADESIMHFEQAYALSPGQVEYGLDLVSVCTNYGHYDEAERTRQVVMARTPGLVGPRLFRFYIRYLATGEITGWREEFDRLRKMTDDGRRAPYSTGAMFTILRDYPGLIAFVESLSDEEWDSPYPREYWLGLAHTAAGATGRARSYLESVAARGHESEDSYERVHAAVALDLLGQRAEALQAADAGLRLLKEPDARNNPAIRMTRAWVLIRSGARAEEGYAELKSQLGQYEQQPRWVAVNLPWVLLRDDARVQQIIRDALPR